MAGDNQQFCLRWNNHQSTLISVFDSLLESGTLVDCTLAAEGQYLKAHKVVLSACSPYLELLLSQHYEKHPIVILKDVKFQELKSMMDYMYRGEVNITQDQLATFLKAAESLQIKGLSESSGSTDDARDVGSTAKRPREEPPPRRPVPPHPQARLPHSSGLTIEPRRSIPHSSEMAPASPMKSREGSTSPVARKRRRRRPSGGDDASNAALSDSQLDTSNSCDLPPVSNQAQSTPISVPSILATPSASNNQSESDQPLETEALSRFPNTTGSELMVKTKMEPNTDQLIEPKTEYLEDINNEDSVEDLTLDDDDEMPGPSHADGSNQNFSQWQMAGDRSTDEVFMAAQEAVGAHRDSQDKKSFIHRLGLIKSEKDGVPDLKHMAKNCQVNSMNSLNNMNNMNSMNSVGAGANNMGFLHGNNLGPSASELYENLLMHSSNDRQHYLSNALSISQRYLDQLQNCNTGVVALHNNSTSNNSYVDYYESSSDVSTAEMSMQEYSMNSSGNNSMLMEYRPRKHNKDKEPVFGCEDCGKRYRSKTSLSLHKRLECGKEPAFACPFCPLKTHQKGNLQVHIKKKHSNPREFPGHTLT